MAKYKKIVVPNEGEKITIKDGKLSVPNNPVIPFIEGDGTGPDIWFASKMVFDAAVEKAYDGKKKIVWMEVFAGEKQLDYQTLPGFFRPRLVENKIAKRVINGLALIDFTFLYPVRVMANDGIGAGVDA
ncbi:MAG: hypothetical protein A3J84_03705 [Ignavibacteria bacterium RIFOXYA2_FULL_37_17]|nr:MAG: hypothetical protein A3J84_03705 [Ignavibacteria bacterium RIFOXYA2_FULL_37_17]